MCYIHITDKNGALIARRNTTVEAAQDLASLGYKQGEHSFLQGITEWLPRYTTDACLYTRWVPADFVKTVKTDFVKIVGCCVLSIGSVWRILDVNSTRTRFMLTNAEDSTTQFVNPLHCEYVRLEEFTQYWERVYKPWEMWG